MTPCFSKLRDEEEILRAHDILEAVLLGELPRLRPEDPDTERALAVAAGVLCWVLQHPEGSLNFEANLARIERAAKDAGYTLKKVVQ